MTSPEYGPAGYLPERAARRARKIVLRAPLGLGWVLAAAAAGVAILVVGAVFFRTATAPPSAPFVAVGAVETVQPARYDPGRGILYVGAAGRVRAFQAPTGDTPLYCAESGRLESPAGRVWNLVGRGIDGGASLREHPAVVHRGVVYVDPTRLADGLPPVDERPARACAG